MLSLRHTQSGSIFTLAIAGELALETVDDLPPAVAARSPETTRVVLDCSQLVFADSTGVNALLQVSLGLKRLAIAVDVVHLNSDLKEMLDILGFFEVLGSP